MSRGSAPARRQRLLSWGRSVPVAWVVLIAASLAWFARQPGLSPAITIYADDAIFLSQADQSGGAAFWSPYNGYLHTLPRLIAWLAASVSMTWASLTIAIAALLVLFACLAFIYLTLRNQPGLVGRYAVLIAAVPALMPVAAAETIANAASLQWYLLTAGIIITALGRTEWSSGWPVAVLLLVAGLSSPLALVLLPGAGFALWRARRGGAGMMAAVLPGVALLVGLAVQVARSAEGPPAENPLGIEVASTTTLNAIALLVGPMPLLGSDTTYHLAIYVGVPIVVLLLATWAVVWFALRQAAREITPLADFVAVRMGLLFAPGLVIVVIAPLIRPELRSVAIGNPGGSRYAVPLGAAMWLVIGIALAVALSRVSWQRMTLGTSLALVPAVVVLSLGWSANVSRARGPIWPSSYERACEQKAPGTVVTVATTPDRWSATVRC